MNIINRVLIPINFSNSSKAASNYVCGMAKADSTLECCLLHVLSEGEDIGSIKEELESYKSKFINEGVNCETFIEKGEMNEVIIEAKKSKNIDLIIMGTAGSLSGEESKTTELLEKSNCPVLIIPECTTDFKMDSIVLAIDENQFDDASDLQLFHDLAKWFNAKVHLLKVDRGDEGDQKISSKKEETLEYYLQCLEYQYSFPKNTDIEMGIANYIKEKKIDALAIISGKKDKGRLAKALVLHTSVPLLVLG